MNKEAQLELRRNLDSSKQWLSVLKEDCNLSHFAAITNISVALSQIEASLDDLEWINSVQK